MKVCTQCKLAALCLGGVDMFFMPSYEPWYDSGGRVERVALRVEVVCTSTNTFRGRVYTLSNDCPDKRGHTPDVEGD